MKSVMTRFPLVPALNVIAFAVIVASTGTASNAASAEPQRFSPAALKADLHFAVETIERQHPELAHSVNQAQLNRIVKKIERQLVRQMDQTQAWATFAQLNPVLADGHLFIGLPDWRAQSAEAVRSGIGLFPFEIRLDPEGYPVIVSALGGSDTPLAGRRIISIDGTDARRVASTLLARTHGDTHAFRKALLAQRWWLLHWKFYGASSAYKLVIDGQKKPQIIPAGHALPEILQQESSFERAFACQVDADGSARMKVTTFAWEDKGRFFQFTHDCFAQMKMAATRHLVIDVSANGGGDDDMWKDGILRYIATRPYRHGSDFVKRERSGEIARGSIETMTEAVSDEPLRFSGKVTVLIGPLTYSSAVLFSNVIRDYGFGELVGTGSAARTRQTGGVQSVKLPNTGLILSYPRFVLSPPSGETSSQFLEAAPQSSPSNLADTSR